MRTLLFGVLPFVAILSQAQPGEDPRVFRPSTGTTAQVDTPITPAAGKVTVHESERIAQQMKDYAGHKQVLKGYRVQIFLGDRNTAEDKRRAFLLHHPDIPAYLSYLAPNFRVRVGDLRDRIAAEKLRAELKADHPGLYVVPDEIELPRLADEEKP